MVGQIGRPVEAKSGARLRSVDQGNRKEGNSEEVDRPAVDRAGRYSRFPAGVRGFSLKGIGEDSLQVSLSFWSGVDRYSLSTPVIERPDVIEAHDVVSVRVGVEDGVQGFEPRPEGLLPEIRRGVDQHVPFRLALPKMNHDGRAQSLVTRIVRPANRAGTSDRRHADACTRPKDGD